VHVADEGLGFPDGFAPRAFDRFSRADDARSRSGSGLGLAIVDTIAGRTESGAEVAPSGGVVDGGSRCRWARRRGVG
jgi:signal transduction histidine kinase